MQATYALDPVYEPSINRNYSHDLFNEEFEDQNGNTFNVLCTYHFQTIGTDKTVVEMNYRAIGEHEMTDSIMDEVVREHIILREGFCHFDCKGNELTYSPKNITLSLKNS